MIKEEDLTKVHRSLAIVYSFSGGEYMEYKLIRWKPLLSWKDLWFALAIDVDIRMNFGQKGRTRMSDELGKVRHLLYMIAEGSEVVFKVSDTWERLDLDEQRGNLPDMFNAIYSNGFSSVKIK